MIQSLSRWVECLDDARGRWSLYGLLVAVYFIMALTLGRADGPLDSVKFNLVHSDGRYYYAYLPSLILDGNLDFANQVREHWGAEFHSWQLEDRTELGYVRNKYPVGFALTLLPAFLIGHALALGLYGLTNNPWFACDGYTLPYQVCCLAVIAGLAWLALMLVDRLLSERFGVRGRFTAAGVGLSSFGTHLAYYSFREPFMVHIISMFWCTLCIYLTDCILHELDGRRLSQRTPSLLALAFVLAVLCRPTNLFVLPFVVYLFVRTWRAGMLRVALVRLPLAVTLAVAPLLMQLAAWRATTGHWICYSYREEGFAWARPALWQTLFSSRHGLLFWSPLLVLALAGLASRLRREPDGLLICALLGAGILWYCNSAWHTWWFGASFGARAFLEVSALFALGLAFQIERVWTAPSRRWHLAQGVFVLLAVAYNWGLMFLYFKRYIPQNDYLF